GALPSSNARAAKARAEGAARRLGSGSIVAICRRPFRAPVFVENGEHHRTTFHGGKGLLDRVMGGAPSCHHHHHLPHFGGQYARFRGGQQRGGVEDDDAVGIV